MNNSVSSLKSTQTRDELSITLYLQSENLELFIGMLVILTVSVVPMLVSECISGKLSITTCPLS